MPHEEEKAPGAHAFSRYEEAATGETRKPSPRRFPVRWGPSSAETPQSEEEKKRGGPQGPHPPLICKEGGAAAEEAAYELINEVVCGVMPEEAAVEGCAQRLRLRLHAAYLLMLGNDPFSLEAFFAISLKMGGAYWASSALWLLGLTSSKTRRLLSVAPTAFSKTEEEAPAANLVDIHTPSSNNNSNSSNSNVDNNNNNDSSSSSGSSSSGVDDGGVDHHCRLDELLESREEALCQWVLGCMRPCGGFAHEANQDAHLTATHYALLLLAGLGRLHLLPEGGRKTASWVLSLQNADGSFRGDAWGEADSRFSYCGVGSLLLLNALDSGIAMKAVGFVRQLINPDGGFAWVPGGESHAASAFCCLATLAVCGGLWAIDRQASARWLAERQTPGGGFNGRPEKAPDVCYSFWIYSSLQILGYGRWIDRTRLCSFILEAQDTDTGGIADRPADVADPFHTFFGLAALGMLGASPLIEPLDPVLALPTSVVKRLCLPRFSQSYYI